MLSLKTKRFDLIYLSNIPSYLKKPASFSGSLTTFFNNIILKNLSKLLSKTGEIAYCEVYSFFKDKSNIPKLATQDIIRKIRDIGDFEVEQNRVHGHYNKRKYDIIIRLKPV